MTTWTRTTRPQTMKKVEKLLMRLLITRFLKALSNKHKLPPSSELAKIQSGSNLLQLCQQELGQLEYKKIIEQTLQEFKSYYETT